MSRKNRADRIEAVLRRADATLETWYRRAKKRGAGVLRHRVDDLQTGLKKLSAGLEQLERDHKVTPARQLEGDPPAAPKKRRTRPTGVRKPASARKQKKAA